MKKIMRVLLIILIMALTITVTGCNKKCTIKTAYQVENGEIVSLNQTFKVETGSVFDYSTISKDDIPVRNNSEYKLDGWFVGDQKINREYVVLSDVTIVAKYSLVGYAVTVNYKVGENGTVKKALSLRTDSWGNLSYDTISYQLGQAQLDPNGGIAYVSTNGTDKNYNSSYSFEADSEILVVYRTAEAGKLRFEKIEDGKARCLGFDLGKIPTEVVIPSTVEIDSETLTVEEIDKLAFYNLRVNKLTIPSTIKKIDESAFYNAVIWYVIVEDIDAYASINFVNHLSSPFYAYGANLEISGYTGTTLSINSSKISSYAFERCNNLSSYGDFKSIVIGSNVREIGDYAFAKSGLNELNYITLNNGVQKIGKYAFDGITVSNQVTLPESLQEMGLYAFETENMVNSRKTVVKDYRNGTLWNLCYDDGRVEFSNKDISWYESNSGHLWKRAD